MQLQMGMRGRAVIFMAWARAVPAIEQNANFSAFRSIGGPPNFYMINLLKTKNKKR